MRRMSFILPILRISAVVRDAFIEVFWKAINSSLQHIRAMFIFDNIFEQFVVFV